MNFRQKIIRIKRYTGMGLELVLKGRFKISVIRIRKAELRAGKVVLSGDVLTNHKPQPAIVNLRKFREEEISHDFVVDYGPVVRRRGVRRLASFVGLRWTAFSVTLDFPWAKMPSSIYGLSHKAGLTTRSAIRIDAGYSALLSDDETDRTYCIFRDPSVQVPRIEMYHFGSRSVANLRAEAQKPQSAGIRCIIGEYTNTARDNGQALFEGLVADYPDIQPTYVIEKDNADSFETNQPGVVIFGSQEHLTRCLQARICAFTHHRTYVYPYLLKMIAPQRYDMIRTVFLQHGIIALKRNIVQHYHASRLKYDAFCVSSETERQIIVDHFGYPADDVHITGLARHDRLVRTSRTLKSDRPHILVFPTWRQNLDRQSTRDIARDPFVTIWRCVLSDLRRAGFESCLILHPILQRHSHLFSDVADKIANARDFQKNLVASYALVTDYSSVSFDALLLRKPVFLFQPDQDDGTFAKDAFIDIDTDLPGPVFDKRDALIQALEHSRADGWAFTKDQQRDLYFAHGDTGNVQRIAGLIRAAAKDESVYRR